MKLALNLARPSEGLYCSNSNAIEILLYIHENFIKRAVDPKVEVFHVGSIMDNYACVCIGYRGEISQESMQDIISGCEYWYGKDFTLNVDEEAVIAVNILIRFLFNENTPKVKQRDLYHMIKEHVTNSNPKQENQNP